MKEGSLMCDGFTQVCYKYEMPDHRDHLFVGMCVHISGYTGII